MIEGVLAIVVASGLIVSLLGAWKALRSSPLLGGDKEGYLSGELPDLDTALKDHRLAWTLVLVGFFLQFTGTAGLAVLAFCRAAAD